MSTLDPTDSATPAPDIEQSEQRSPRRGLTGWLISGTTHVLVLTLLALAYQVVKPDSDTVELPPFRPATLPPKPESPPMVTALTLPDPNQVPVPMDPAEVSSPVSELVLPDELTSSDSNDDQQQPKGTDSIADAAMAIDSTALIAAIGPGSSAPGLYGPRDGGSRGRGKRIKEEGGDPVGVSMAIDHALRWFKRHQHPTGQWDPQQYFRNCTEAWPKCEPGDGQRDGQVTGVTGYVLLCYLISGYDQTTPNRYKATVKKTVDWLLAQQHADGSWGRNYEHAIVTMALAEDFSMTSDPAVGAAAARGVAVILKRQNRDSAVKAGASSGSNSNALGWDYGDASARNDASVSGWNTMALKSALAADIKVDDGLKGAKRWLDASWKAANPGWEKLDPYKGESRFPYTWTTGSSSVEISPGPSEEKDLACVGGMCAVFLGHLAGDPMLETLTNYTLKHQLPAAWPCNTYYLYYNTMAMFQVGGDKWKTWSAQVMPMLAKAQRLEEGCMDGSWDWQGTKFPGNDVGRTLSTAYCVLTLETYFNLARVAQAQRMK